jgi:hypothetical protein
MDLGQPHAPIIRPGQPPAPTIHPVQSLRAPAVSPGAELRLDSPLSTRTTASPTAGIVKTVHVSRTPEVAPGLQRTTVASFRSTGPATRATPLPLVTVSQTLEDVPGLQPTTVATRRACLPNRATALAPALSRTHTLARTCTQPTPTSQLVSTVLAAPALRLRAPVQSQVRTALLRVVVQLLHAPRPAPGTPPTTTELARVLIVLLPAAVQFRHALPPAPDTTSF